MKLSVSRSELILFLIASGFWYLAEVADGVDEFRRCYNTSLEMHCFAVQYDTNNGPLITSNDNARQRCNILNSTLIIIKSEEINNIVKNYMSDPFNPIRDQYVWMDAYRISDFNNSYTWHWVNSRLPNLATSEVSWIFDYTCYVATLEFRSDNGKSQFYLTAKQPHFSYSYICEYAVSICPSTGSNVRLIADRCYIAVNELVSWYEARNRCLKDGGDLASFANVTSINFPSWLGSDPYVRFWIGLRFTWYIWKNSGEEVKFSKWIPSAGDWTSVCLIVCSNCSSSVAWLPIGCNIMNSVYVVCHSVTPLVASTTSMIETSISATIATSTTTIPNGNMHQVMPSSSRSADGALGIGLGVGLGVPLVIFIILTVFFAVKSKRLETLLEQKTRNDRTELGTVQESSAGQVNESASDQYQQLNRNLDNSSGTMYDKLRVEPEQNYEEFPPNRT